MVDDTTDKIKTLLEEAKLRERALRRGSRRSVTNVEIETEVPLISGVDTVETVGGADIVEKVDRETSERSQRGRDGQGRQSSRPNHGDNDAGENAGNQEGDGGQENKDGGDVAGENNGGEDKGETNNEKDKDKDDEEGKGEKDKGGKEGEGGKANGENDNKDSEGEKKGDKDIADELEESKNRERAARNSGGKEGDGAEPQSGAGGGDNEGGWDWKKAMQGDGNIAENVANYAKERAKKKAKKAAKKLAKTAFKRFIWPVLIAIFGNPITWVVILAIFCFAVLISYCDSFWVSTASKVGSFTTGAPDFCSVFKGITGENDTVNQYGGGGEITCQTKLTEPEAWGQLQAANIPRNNPAPQTNFEGINQATITEVINLKQNCNCYMIVTGGTESGYHAEGGQYSHVNGYKIDLGLNDALNSYIEKSFTPNGKRSGDNAPLWKAPSGAIYAKEGNHWDILVNCLK
jgi:hypothetical protein